LDGFLRFSGGGGGALFGLDFSEGVSARCSGGGGGALFGLDFSDGVSGGLG